MIELSMLVLTVYAVTFVLVSSSLFAPIRGYLTVKMPWLRINGYTHMFECRMCTGFWVAVIVCAIAKEWHMTLAVYGASYFMATQERK